MKNCILLFYFLIFFYSNLATTNTTKITPTLGSFQNNLNNNNGIKPYSTSTGSFAIKPTNTFSGGNIYGTTKILSSTSNDTLKKLLDDDDDF